MSNQPPDLFIVQSGLLSEAAAPTHQAAFTTDRRRYELADGQDELRVILRWRSDDGVSVDKHYVFRRNSYVVRVEHALKNDSQQAWAGRMYAQIQREFGWGPFREVLAGYEALPADEQPKTRTERIDQWMLRMSLATGRDLRAFFDRWRLSISDAARTDPRLKDLKSWMPEFGDLRAE